MLEIRRNDTRKRVMYLLENRWANSTNTIAIFDKLADAALALRFMRGGNLTDGDLSRAREIFARVDNDEAGH